MDARHPELQIAPSILSADFAALGRDIAAAERGGADLIHVDVMDGRFVPNLTFGPMVVRAIRRVATRPLDVHLMVENPDDYIDEIVEAGAAMVSVHVEAAHDVYRTVQRIRDAGGKPGVVLNPATPVDALEDIATDTRFRGRYVRESGVWWTAIHSAQSAEAAPCAGPPPRYGLIRRD